MGRGRDRETATPWVRDPAIVALTNGGLLALTCEAHGAHEPPPTYLERHHVIPQAWQQTWQPAQPWPEQGPGQQGTLWDARTATVCRTGHGNVHYWLVRFMRALTPGGTIEQAVAAVKHAARAEHMHMGKTEAAYAVEGMLRYQTAGGDLDALVRAHEWGQI